MSMSTRLQRTLTVLGVIPLALLAPPAVAGSDPTDGDTRDSGRPAATASADREDQAWLARRLTSGRTASLR